VPRTTPLLAATLAALLAGCAAVAPADRPGPAADVADAWREALPPADVATGWRGFGDATLGTLVGEALAANPDLRSARAALAQARAQRDATAAAGALQLGSSASAGRNRTNRVDANTLKAGVDASWELDAFGALDRGTAAAEASAEASAASLAATRLSVAGEVAVAYWTWQGTRERLALAQQSVQAQAQTLEIVRWRVAAGLATSLDAEQAQGNLESTRATLPALQKTLQQTEHALAVLTGRAPGAFAARLAAVPPTPAALPTLPAAGLPAEWLRRRPDVRAAEWQATAAWHTLAVREAERRPTFRLSGSLGWQAATWSALGGPASLVAGLAAAVDWPLLDGGAAKARVAVQQAVLDGAEAQYQAAVLAAQQDVEDNLVALSTGRERVARLEAAAAAADTALLLARQRYQAGLVDFTTLLDTQRSALAAQDSLSSARTELALTHVRLAKALGGAWPEPA
jgi:outer membrane protein, multidrug efflux system